MSEGFVRVWLRRRRLGVRLAYVFALVCALLPVMGGAVPAAATLGTGQCASTATGGGDWTSLNHDVRNTRFQVEEDQIGASQAASLVPAWTFRVPVEVGKERSVQSTPIVANGCVYFTVAEFAGVPGLSAIEAELSGGTVFALNADTGELVWETDVNGFVLGLSAADGLIYALPSASTSIAVSSGVVEPKGAHAIALDAFTGEIMWSSERLDSDDVAAGWLVSASPVLFTPTQGGQPTGRKLLFVPISAGAGDGARVPLYFLDARTGHVVKRFYALSEADYAAGYGGAGIWSTAAFDATTNYLYAGTADSEGHTMQHPRNNAILKIDADPSRVTFGSVVDAYTATTEHYNLDTTMPDWQNNLVCELDSNGLPRTDESASTACLELDNDFGASPNLYVDSGGRTIVAALQKSGILHVADTATMNPAWTKILSAPDAAGNASTGATDGTNLFVQAAPDLVYSFERSLGARNWISNTGVSALSYQPLTAANGVLYTITDLGHLVGFSASTGLPLLERAIYLDAATVTCAGTGAGVAVARHTVYAPCDAGGFTLNAGSSGALVAYRPAP